MPVPPLLRPSCPARLWVPNIESRDQGVFMDQAAEPVPAQNAYPGHVAEWMCAPGGRVLLQRPVRPVDVVVVGVLAKSRTAPSHKADQARSELSNLSRSVTRQLL